MKRSRSDSTASLVSSEDNVSVIERVMAAYSVVQPLEKESLAESESHEASQRLEASEVRNVSSVGQRQIALLSEPAQLTSRELSARKIIHSQLIDSPIGNTFRQLRRKLLQDTHGVGKTILVTSASPRGGSSFVVVNLATAIALDETKTALIIDCNVGKHTSSYGFTTETRAVPGLTDYLCSTEISIEQIMHPTGIPRVHVIPIGTRPGLGGEPFASSRMSNLWKELRVRCEGSYIIVDAPCVNKSVHPVVLSDKSDYVLLVVPYGKVTDAQVRSAVDAIGREKIFGLIFNNKPGGLQSYGY